MAINGHWWIFDARVVCLEVSRGELALVKQNAGEDSPETALLALAGLHQGWILKAGVLGWGGYVDGFMVYGFMFLWFVVL